MVSHWFVVVFERKLVLVQWEVNFFNGGWGEGPGFTGFHMSALVGDIIIIIDTASSLLAEPNIVLRKKML